MFAVGKRGDSLKIKVEIIKGVDEKGEVVILADVEGLKYLADAFQRVSGKSGPNGHFHFEWQFNNLVQGSNPMTVQYSADPADFKDEANSPGR